ncbi:hypothetical protein MMA231_01313 [Asticcacaulis sp. MM231]|uniref:pyridoxamine 5'-phosphate oxidase family protein n=1 Tax=Asticcacaulis sp. MM231 TaxID=3157666 RepID=UPI0032D56C37
MSLTLEEISKTMRHIDLCMMTTKTADGALESRPMSNNKQVDYDGNSYFFATADSSAAQEIAADPQVNIAFTQLPSLISGGFFLSVTGKAELIDDKPLFEKHWVKDIEVWFKDGIDTPGLRLIKVKAKVLKYWHNYEEGELYL